MIKLVDDREPQKIINKLAEQGWVKQRLPVGDYIIENTVFERKTIEDFIASYLNKRIDKQIVQMKDSFDNCVVLITGNYSSYVGKHVKMKIRFVSADTFTRMISSLAARYNVSVINLISDAQVPVFLDHYSKRIGKGTKKDAKISLVKKTKEDVNIAMLMQIPGIGYETAKAIIGRFGSVKEISKIPAEELMKVKGVGRITAEKIKEWV